MLFLRVGTQSQLQLWARRQFIWVGRRFCAKEQYLRNKKPPKKGSKNHPRNGRLYQEYAAIIYRPKLLSSTQSSTGIWLTFTQGLGETIASELQRYKSMSLMLNDYHPITWVCPPNPLVIVFPNYCSWIHRPACHPNSTPKPWTWTELGDACEMKAMSLVQEGQFGFSRVSEWRRAINFSGNLT